MIISVTIIICFLFLLLFIDSIYKHYIILMNFKNYHNLLVYFLDISYEKIYKEQILIYSASSFKLDKRMEESILRDTIKLTLEIMGPKVEKILIEFYGSRKVLISNIIFLVNNRLDSDEILEHTRKIKEFEKENK